MAWVGQWTRLDYWQTGACERELGVRRFEGCCWSNSKVHSVVSYVLGDASGDFHFFFHRGRNEPKLIPCRELNRRNPHFDSIVIPPEQ